MVFDFVLLPWVAHLIRAGFEVGPLRMICPHDVGGDSEPILNIAGIN